MLLLQHHHYSLNDQSFGLEVDEDDAVAASEGEPFESVLEGLANFHIVSLIHCLMRAALLMYHPHSSLNADLLEDNWERSSMEPEEVPQRVVCDNPVK